MAIGGLGKAAKNSQQTQTVKPPKYAMPYINRGLQDTLNQYEGSTNPYQARGNEIVLDRVNNGSAPINAANDYVTRSLNGDFLNANPYLDATFNQAAQATQSQLASQFAGSGRNVDQSQGLRAQQLNDLATQIYGGAYNTDRALQQGALGSAQALGNQAYIDAGAVGNLKTPESSALDEYLRRVSGQVYGNTQSAGSGGFNTNGALGGAMAGSAFGPYGMLIGAGLGGFL